MDLNWLETQFEALAQQSEQAIETQLQAWSASHPQETVLLRKMMLHSKDATRFDDPLRLEYVQTKPKVEDHTIGETLGQGGMGTVYFAKQHKPIERQVALKILHINLPVHVTKFIEERQTLSRLQHPNIAQVLQAGVDQMGRPWFTMPIIEGQPLIEFCQRFKLGMCERLELFMQVCDGIQHSHQRGVIHRDIKPSNVLASMIDGKPTVKIIDFGIATNTAAAVSKRDSPFLGSIPYISPEQLLQDDVDTRSDVFSLGVLLYELLVGLPPFPIDEDTTPLAYEALLKTHQAIKPSQRLRENAAHLKRQAQHMNMKPKALTAGINHDLTAVVMKCLVYDKRGRYASVDALAKDLQALLNNDPVSVRKPKLLEWPIYFYHRNPLKAILYGLIVALIPISITVYIRYQESQFERQRAEQDKIHAEELKQTYQDMNRNLWIFQSSWNSDRTPLEIRQILAFTEHQFKKLSMRSEEDRLYSIFVLAGLHFEIGDYPKSKTLYEEAIHMLKKRPLALHWRTLQAYTGYARSQLELGAFETAKDTFEYLIEITHSDPSFSIFEIRAQLGLGLVNLSRGETQAAHARFRDWIPKLDQHPEVDPLEVHSYLIVQAVVGGRLGKFDIAIEKLQSSINYLEENTYKHHPFLLSAKFNLASLLISQRIDLRLAGELHCEVFETRVDLFDIDHPMTLRSLDALARYDIELKHYTDALQWLQEVQRRDPNYSKFSPKDRLQLAVRQAIVHNELGLFPLEQIYSDLYDEVQIARSKNLWNAPIYLVALNNLGNYCVTLNQLELAKTHLDEAVAIHRAQTPLTNRSRLIAETTLGEIFEALGQVFEAIEIYNDLLPRLNSEPGLRTYVTQRLRNLQGQE